ncbi:MAG: heavy metal sensor histidine kinase [Zoogloea sp.]|nr:heavy metal sensor histidine kinase [Zoogloea sp.]
MLHRSIALRLTLLFAAVSAAVLVGLGGFITSSVGGHFAAMDRDELLGKLELTRHALAKVETPDGLPELSQQLADSFIGHHGLAVRVDAADGTPLFATPEVHWPDEATTAAADARPEPALWEHDGHSYRGIVAEGRSGIAGRPAERIAIALDIGHHRQFIADFERSLWVSIALAILLTGALGWLAARRGLVPVRRMAEVAAGISAERLHGRIPTENLPAELVDLGRAFNDMLARLEDSFRRLSDFSSDIAHELRTPISNLMTQTQVALGKARAAEEYREVLYSSLEEYDRLARMIGDMLFLAKADNGLITPSREPVDLAAEVARLFEFYEALAEEQGVALAADGAATIPGDRLMLRRALSNLLSNALRHTPRGGTVAVRIASGAAIAVENPGDTIPAEHLPRLFDRFYRVDPSRQRESEGTGLGLAITRSIVEAHGGRIGAASEAGLTRFVVELPA